MAKTISKLFKRPEEADQAISDLKAKGYEATVIERGSENELNSMGLSEQALDYYKMGLSVGGKIVKVSTDEDKADDVNKLLLRVGFREFTDLPVQWTNSPGFVRAARMSATHPLDAKMTGDFRKY